jgi:hypothetical protein
MDTTLFDSKNIKAWITFGRYPNQTWAAKIPRNQQDYLQHYQPFECPPKVLVVNYHDGKAVIYTRLTVQEWK